MNLYYCNSNNIVHSDNNFHHTFYNKNECEKEAISLKANKADELRSLDKRN